MLCVTPRFANSTSKLSALFITKNSEHTTYPLTIENGIIEKVASLDNEPSKKKLKRLIF